MIISTNWLKQFTEIKGSVDELATLIGERLVEVEEVIHMGARYQGATIAKVMHVRDHPNADKLHIVHIDDGKRVKNVERMEGGLVEVVCGAPNVAEEMFVVWLPPGSVVPATYGGKEPFTLEARALRGVTSNGMLASARELAIGDDHAGIVSVDKPDVQPGDDFAKTYELDDYLLDIENKSLTHRPDCFGLIGFAREVAAIQGVEFKTPEWLLTLEPELAPMKQAEQKVALSVEVADPSLSARYEAVALGNIDAHMVSPFAIQTWLARVGIRPISAVVDITNYLMYLTGQPLHAFDMDKLLEQHPEKKLEMNVRLARADETMALLDGRTITLDQSDIVICNGPVPVALAGAMGGAATEIDDSTKRVVLESATFDLYRLRTTSMRHGLFSEAVTRFTKGQPAAQTAPVLASAVRMLCDITGGERLSEVADSRKGAPTRISLELTAEKINDILGSHYQSADMARTLGAANFEVEERDGTLKVTAPYWRADIHIDEDIAEEIGRLNGFDSITPVLPLRPMKAVMPSSLEQFQQKLRQSMSGFGANEVLTHSFISERLMRQTNGDEASAYRITNSISPELAYMRTSLMPSLLAKVTPNHKLGYGAFTMYELNKVHTKREQDEHDLPIERHMFAGIFSADKKAAENFKGAVFYQAKHYLEMTAKRMGAALRYVPLDAAEIPEWLQRNTALYEPKRAAIVLHGERTIGVIGELRSGVRKSLKLPDYIAAFELDTEILHESVRRGSGYTPISRYQGTSRDLCFRVSNEVTYEALYGVIQGELEKSQLETSIEPIDIYQKKGSDYKQITLRVTLVNRTSTISSTEVDRIIGSTGAAVREQLSAKLV